MADQFSRLYDVERVGGDQRTRLAELLRSQGMNQPQGQMVGGWYVPPSWSQNLNSALQMGLGTYMGAKIDEERNQQLADLMRRRKEGVEVPAMPAVQNINGMERMGEGQTPFPQTTQAPQNELERLTRKTPVSLEQSQISPAVQQQQAQPKYRPMTEAELEENTLQMYKVDPRMASVISSMDATRAAREEARAMKEEQRAWQSQENQLNRQARREDKQMMLAMRQPAGGGADQWKYDAGSDTWVMPPNAQFPMGRQTPNVAKVGALQNVNYLTNQFTGSFDAEGKPIVDKSGKPVNPGLLNTTPQGGWMGITGLVGGATDSQAAKAFDNKVEQLSTEMRKIFRIPGEGALSDKEQAQYGIQLPKRGYDEATNRQILQDLQTRAGNAVIPGGVNPLQMNPNVGTGYGAPPAGAVREKRR